jgi:hypothetical protein
MVHRTGPSTTRHVLVVDDHASARESLADVPHRPKARGCVAVTRIGR